MKKAATIILVALSALLILDSMQAGQALMMFLLAGIIPGTSVVMSGSAALSLFASLAGFTVARLSSRLTASADIEHPSLQNA